MHKTKKNSQLVNYWAENNKMNVFMEGVWFLMSVLVTLKLPKIIAVIGK